MSIRNKLSPLRVAYDSQIFSLQERGGIGTYFANLISEFRSHPELGIEPILLRKRFLSASAQEKNLSRKRGRLSGLPIFLEGQIDNFRLKSIRPDLIHRTYYHPSFLFNTIASPKVDTLHDMIPELFGQTKNEKNTHLAKEHFLESSSGLISVSQTSLADAQNHYGTVPENSTVIHHGLGSPVPAKKPKMPQFIEPGFWLFVGERAGYKDWITLINGLAQLHASGSGGHLVCASARPFSPQEESLIRQKGLELNVAHVAATDSELTWLYQNARALVFTSKYEGFGFPPLESLALGGCAVIAATPVAKEIFGLQYPLFYDPGDFIGLASVLKDLEEDENKNIEQWRLIALNSSTYEMARKTADFYRATVDKKTASC